jgi:hypothetical protein
VMLVRNLKVESARFDEVSQFVVEHHYMKSVRGITPLFCFRVMHQNQLVGAAIFGQPAMKNTALKYSDNGAVQLVELRRFVMVQEAPRTSEGHVLGIMFRMLAKQDVARILSYADPAHNHTGTIYKGTGFTLVGQTAPVQVIWYRGKKYSTKSINRCTENTRTLGRSARILRQALENGTAEKKYEPGKFIYVKNLNPPVSRESRHRSRRGRRVYDLPVIGLNSLSASENHPVLAIALTAFPSANDGPKRPLTVTGLISSRVSTTPRVLVAADFRQKFQSVRLPYRRWRQMQKSAGIGQAARKLRRRDRPAGIPPVGCDAIAENQSTNVLQNTGISRIC